MKLNKNISVLVAFVVLLTSISYTFTFHYCNNSIAGISLNSFFNETSNASADSCCTAKPSEKSCCSDKVIKIDKSTNNFLSKSVSFEISSAILQPIFYFLFANNQIIDATVKSTYFFRNSNAPPLYKLNCQFIFYA